MTQELKEILSPKQLDFIAHANARWNIAHGSVRSSKTVCATFLFMIEAAKCPDNQIWIVGKSATTIYDNVISLILDSPTFAIFRPFVTWHKGSSVRKLTFFDKEIKTIGAKDEGAIGQFQGKTMSLVYCDEMTLYPTSIIEMIDSRLSCPWSKGIATMNPTYPSHIVKQWIDRGIAGDKNYYSSHFTLDDNPYVDQGYKDRIKNIGGLFHKRNYLGMWCLAEGAIFDFFDKDIYVVKKPPRAADYWIAGIDVGTSNAFACVLIGVNTGRYDQNHPIMWVEKEYFWDSKKQGRQKTNSEYADDISNFLEPYGVKQLYIDPSAAAFKVDLRKRGFHPVDADNDVYNGITHLGDQMQKGSLFICKECPNLIREIESYTWDSKASEKGDDEPIKKDDHAIDALRYACYTHKISTYDYQEHNKRQQEYWTNRFGARNFQ